MKGVLESWALPKIPPRTKGLRRLAIYTNPHALSYAKFEGTIPKGSYGAGTVKIWDKGTYSIVEKAKGKLVVNFKGKKLKGEYALILFRPPKNWLFFKK
jgi:DNA ligase D-like protein (predicted 3'-phosphoesterase)